MVLSLALGSHMHVLTSILEGAPLQISRVCALQVSQLQYSLMQTLPSLVSYPQLHFLNSLSPRGSACVPPPHITVGTPSDSKLDQL